MSDDIEREIAEAEERLRQLHARRATKQFGTLHGAVNVDEHGRIYGPTVGVNLGIIIYGRDPREEERRQLIRYLHTLAAKLYRLPLRGLDERLDQGNGVALPRVYVSLATTSKRPAVQGSGEQPYLIMLGEPGSGKSTFVRHLAWALAQRTLHPEQGQKLLVDYTYQQAQLPIVLSLRELAARLDRDGTHDQAVAAALVAILRAYGSDQPESLLRDALDSGAALLLFDGLDEVPAVAIPGTTTNRLTVAHAVQSFCRTYPSARAVITCRTRAFDARLRNLLGWPVETLARFTATQMRAFAKAWYAELAANGQIEPAQVPRLAGALIGVVEDSPKLSDMAGTPLLLMMMALVLYRKGELPRDRPKLYEQILELLLGQWDKVRDGQSFSEAIGLHDWDSTRIRPLLDQLSYQAHLRATSRDGRGRLARSDVRNELEQFFRESGLADDRAAATAVRCLDYFNQRSGLLVPDDAKDSYVFVHLTLQEHCAGRYIVFGPDAAELVLRYRADDRWREPIFLGLGVAQEYNPTLIDRVLSDLLDRQERGVDKEDERWLSDLLLADEIGQDRDWVYMRALRVNVERLQRDLKQGFAACLAQSRALDRQIQIGDALGRLGDPRFPVKIADWCAELARRNEDFGRPVGYWCYVPPDSYQIGGWQKGERVANITLAPIWVARFPVTVAQYALFVKQGYGPDAQRWWTPEGWTWKGNRLTPEVWNQSPYDGANQPVIGVTWYEAMAYCAWLTEQLGDTLPLGYVVRLLSEAEWEIAAAYDAHGQRRLYPWGEEAPTQERAFYAASHIGRPAPVGCCSAGMAASGAIDMAGNVWEWTASSYESYPEGSYDLVKDFTRNQWDVSWRGGGWLWPSTSVRCGARDYGSPHVRTIALGFRVVLAARLE